MNQRDQELLDKQLSRITPAPRSEGVMVLAVLTVFFVGMAFGGFLYAYESQPIRIASNDVTPTMAVLNGVPLTIRQ